ncbi:hypothetical protein Tco_1142826 [Tanacetum coccineum]
MVALVISISLDISVESVGSSFPQVILIGFIPVEVPVSPEVGAVAVASPAGVLEFDTHSSLEVDPSESSPYPVSIAPMVSPFLCSDDLESKVASRSSSPTTSTPEIPNARILLTPSVIVAPSSEALTARKSVRPLPSYRLALRFVHRSLARTPRGSETYLHWRSAPLSTMYPPTTSESSAGILLSSHLLDHLTRDAGPFVEEDIDTDVLKDIKADATAVEVAVDMDVEARVDAGIDMEVDVRIGVEDEVEDEVESSDKGTIEVGVDLAAGINIPDAMLMPDAVERLEQVEEGLRDIYDHVIEIPLQRIEDIKTRHREVESRSLIAARADRFRQCVRSMESELRQIRMFRYYDRIRFRRLETFANMNITHSGMTPEAIKELINRRVEETLAAYEATRAANALEAESQSQIGSDTDNGKWQGHYRSDYPKLKDQNHGNKAGNKNGVGEARGKTYVLGRGEANPNLNVVKGNGYLRKGQKLKPKRQNRARERKDHEKPKSPSQSQQKVKKSKLTPG